MKNYANLKEIAIEKLVRGRFQPRKQFDPAKLDELAQAIKKTHGLLQPIIVRPYLNDQYEIIAGERRWRAAMLAGLETVTCIIKEFSDIESMEAAIIENVNRSDLNPIEEARAYERLLVEFDYTHEEIAAVVGTSRTKITNILRLLKLDENVQNWLQEGLLTQGHGKVLAGLPLENQKKLAQKCVKHHWGVRKIEQEAKKISSSSSNEETKDANLKALERSLADHIGCPVSIDYSNYKGTLAINFHNLDILEGLFLKMGFKFS